MSRESMGELEYRVMLALLRLGDDAYTAPIVLELEQRTSRSVRAAAVYIALRRLEDKGLLGSTLRPPGSEGGRDRRHFVVTPEGFRKLRAEYASHMQLLDGLHDVLESIP